MLNAFRETQPLILGLSKHGSLFFSIPHPENLKERETVCLRQKQRTFPNPVN